MVTINDIAKIAGVSVMTVSRALNEPDRVSEATRDKIMAVVDKLGYVQNRDARSLAKGCAFNIGLYIPSDLDSTDIFVARTVSAIGERLGSLGYSLSFRRKMSIDVNCDGIIAVGLHIDEEDEFLRISEQKPAVLYGNSRKFENWVDVDNYKGIYNITKYIIGKGHKKLAYIGMDFSAHHVEQRRCGFADAVRDSGLELDENRLIATDNTEVAGFNACERLLAYGAPTAIVCATDLIAVGCMHALQRKKISIPNDVAVSGFDGFGMEKTVFPKLTTVKQPLFDVGVKLADTVVDMIGGSAPAKGICIEPDVLVGESV